MLRGVVLLIAMAAPAFGADLAGTGGVRGRVVDVEGGAIQVKLNVSDHTESFYHVQSSDASGSFAIDGLSSGSYRIAITAGGFRPAERDVQISPGQTTDLGVIRLRFGGCDFPGVICDTFGIGPDFPGPHSHGNIDVEWDCAFDLDKGEKACGDDAAGSSSDVAIRVDNDGNVYLTPQHRARAGIDYHPDWTEDNCRRMAFSTDAIRIDQFDLSNRVCVRTNAGRYAEVFGFIRLGPNSVRLTFITWN